MKEINLISLLSAFRTLSKDLFDKHLDYYSIKIKADELNGLETFVDHLKSLKQPIDLYDRYFVGYSIPQISKEFDLLRIDANSVVNIELKANSTADKIKNQLIRNRYYLSFLKRRIYSFTYLTSLKKVFTIDAEQDLIEVQVNEIIAALNSQQISPIGDIDSYFNPANYLVSPFNSTAEFISGQYFLTAQQEQIKLKIIDEVRANRLSILGIKGRAGTGKSLLTFDIIKNMMSEKKALTIHCGSINDGHVALRDKYGWDVIPAKYITVQDFSKYQLVVVDEAQRIFKGQLLYIISEVKKYSIDCLFSYDGQQTLKTEEIKNNLGEKIESELTMKPFELTNKIRTNKEVASFIQCLFSNKVKPLENHSYSNIELSYFDNYRQVKAYLAKLRSENWKIINYTPSNRVEFPYESYKLDDETDNAHKVIGQEFNNVVAIIDSHFYYKEGGSLSTRNYRSRPFYHPTKMLFQIVSRTRLKLFVIIIDNPEILNRCLEILKR